MTSTPGLRAYKWDTGAPDKLEERVLVGQTLSKLAESVYGRGGVSCMCLSPDVVLLSVPRVAAGTLLVVGAPGARVHMDLPNLLKLLPASLSLAGAMAAVANFRERVGGTRRIVRAAAVDADFSIRLEVSQAAAMAAEQAESSDEEYVAEDETSSDEESTSDYESE